MIELHQLLLFIAACWLLNLTNIHAIPVNALRVYIGASVARRAAWLHPSLHWLDHTAGAMFMGPGLRLALTGKPGV